MYPRSENKITTAPPQLPDSLSQEQRYLLLLTTALRTCANYQPKFGKSSKSGMTLQQFQIVYGSDPFYSWIGLDSPLMYAAHKAAGGKIYYVVGNSKFYDVMLPVESIYASLFKKVGFINVTIQPIRKRSSKKELFEFIVFAEKP